MKKISLLLSLTIFFILSCKSEKEKFFESKIIGEWNFLKTQSLSINMEEELPLFMAKNGYIFNPDKSCELKPGFLKFVEGKTREQNQIIYLGNSTIYDIENDSLKIKDLETNKWNNYKIVSINSDTLKLQKHSDEISVYYKTNYKLNPRENYDQIILSSSGCYGTCKIYDILISDDEALYFAEMYNQKNGLFASKIKQSKFNEIKNSFKKSNIKSLKNRYSSNWTDLNTITVSFIKNNKIVKTISDYGSENSPDEFQMSYLKMSYLPQQLEFKYLKNKLPFESLSWIKKNKTFIELEKSELFYLYSLILEGKQVFDHKITPLYSLTGFGKDDKKFDIKSDGRYFSVDNKIIDIGFNFFEVNNFSERMVDE